MKDSQTPSFSGEAPDQDGISLQSTNSLRSFGSFPYLLTRLLPGVYHITLYPAEWQEEVLIELARQQVFANKFRACLVLGSTRGLYFEKNGQEEWNSSIPWGGFILSGMMKGSRDFSGTPGFHERQALLEEFIGKGPQ